MKRKLKKIIGAPVFVSWTDACGAGGWRTLRDLEDQAVLPTIKTVGFLFSVTKKALTLVQSSDDGEVFDNFVTIPLVAVASVSRLVPA